MPSHQATTRRSQQTTAACRSKWYRDYDSEQRPQKVQKVTARKHLLCGKELLVELGPKSQELVVDQLQNATAEQLQFVEPPVADEPPPAVAEPQPPPAVVEPPVADEPPPAVAEPQPPPAVVEPPVADESLAELGPKTPAPVVGQNQVELRDNSVSRRRIKCMLDEQYSSQDEYRGSDSDDYMPSDAEQRVCGVPCCSEDIYFGCLHCAAFVCYDHMNTSCSEHTRQAADTDEASGSETSIGNTPFEPCIPEKNSGKRKRANRTNAARHYQANRDNWQKNKRKRARLEGKEYISTKGKVVPEKMCKPCVCSHGPSVIYSLMIAVKTLCLSIMAVLTLVDKEISYLIILCLLLLPMASVSTELCNTGYH